MYSHFLDKVLTIMATVAPDFISCILVTRYETLVVVLCWLDKVWCLGRIDRGYCFFLLCFFCEHS